MQKKPVYILGISSFYHDSAACLVKDGLIIAAAQEERFSREKNDPGFPLNAIAYCFRQAVISVKDIDYVAFYEKPQIGFQAKYFIRNRLRYKGEVLYFDHHQSYAASAFYPSPFQEAAFLSLDAAGYYDTVTFGSGKGNNIEIKHSLRFPHSLGLLYSAFTYHAGFKVNSGEYKLMGLAPYGEPKYKELILKELLDLKEDGSFSLNMEYFRFSGGLRMTNSRFDKLFSASSRRLGGAIRKIDTDMACSIQQVTEEIILRMARYVYEITAKKSLCLAAGVALNCVANGRVLRESPFEDIWIQPASGDAAGALGAALLVWYQYLSNLRNADPVMDSMSGSLLGPAYSDAEIEDSLKKNNAVYENLNQSDLPDIVAGLIEKQNVIGWFQGRLEFGPRALGSRSIIADPRNINMQSRMNSNIKSRESFRPLAPAVLEEFASDWFELDRPSPYMLITAKVKNDKRLPIEDKPDIAERLKIKRSLIPAVTHVDYSSRVQTVNKEFNRLYYEMIRAFYKITGCPAVINTSFNLKEEPIVCTPDDALRCFMRTDLDYLIIGNFLLDKKKQKMPKRREVRFRYRRPAVENAVILLNYLITAITNLLARFMHPDKINLDMATAQSYWLRYQGQIFKAQGAVR